MNGETFAGWGVSASSPRVHLTSCLALLSLWELIPLSQEPKHFANNTAEMTAMVEALYFLGPRGSVARNEEACIFYDSKHAAGVCLGRIQARSHVQLALACQRSTLCATQTATHHASRVWSCWELGQRMSRSCCRARLARFYFQPL